MKTDAAKSWSELITDLKEVIKIEKRTNNLEAEDFLFSFQKSLAYNLIL